MKSEGRWSRHWPLVLLPLVKLVIHLVAYRGYGIFRDELYYIVCSERLAWGYVDHPPLSLAVLRTVRELLGESLFALRLTPALAGAATVLVVGLMARELGGGRFAQALAMTAAVAAPEYLALDHFYSMNALTILLWSLAAYLLVLISDRSSPNRWLLLGLVLGLGLLNKLDVLWLGLGLAVGILATPLRRHLRTPWPWAAAGIAGALLLPHVLWQVAHDWPTLEFIHNATAEKMASIAPLAFFKAQVEMMNPVCAPLWLTGLLWLLLGKPRRSHRALAIAYLVVLLLLLRTGTSRPGYLASAYTWLLAAGAVAWEAGAARYSLPRLRWLAVGVIACVGVLVAPFALPVLPVPSYIAYSQALGVAPSTAERKELAELPQFYADMHGWQEMVTTVDAVYQQLSEPEQRKARVFTGNYGEAGAVDVLGERLGLPPAISGHNTYWLWGPQGATGEVMILIGGRRERLEELFGAVEQAATIECGYCMPYENHQPVWVARDLQVPMNELWPQLKHYD